ncbi:MAG: ribonuclease P protein component, partial [Paracoccaceae bacterium]
GDATPGTASPADLSRLDILRKRSQFLACARARRQAMPGLVVQGRDRADGAAHVGVGFTCTKKVGNAVARNRAKRRLRAAAREVMPQMARPGWDYVLIGRAEATAQRPYESLKSDLARALARLHGAAR